MLRLHRLNRDLIRLNLLRLRRPGFTVDGRSSSEDATSSAPIRQQELLDKFSGGFPLGKLVIMPSPLTQYRTSGKITKACLFPASLEYSSP